MSYVDGADSRRANVQYIRSTMSTPLLSREREQDLARRWRDQGDERALHELVVAYGRLVAGMAGRFRAYGLPMGDLMQEGNVGLMQAAARFEPERGVRFSTYATWWVRSAMQDYVLRNWSIVRTGTTSAQKALFFNLRRLRARIEGTTGQPLTDEGKSEIATTLGVSEREVTQMESRLAASDQSLNAQVGEEGDRDWMDMLADERPTPEQNVIAIRDRAVRSEWVDKALAELPAREARIVRRRLLEEETVTLEELGQELGVSKERVRQLEKRALERLRAALEAGFADPHDLLVEA